MEEEKWTEETIKLARETINEFQEISANQKIAIENFMKMILSNHNSDIFLKNFSPKEIFEINSAKKGFPDVLERILKDNEQIALYKKSLHEIKPNLLFSYLKKLATRTVIIESCISDVKRIIKKDISLF